MRIPFTLIATLLIAPALSAQTLTVTTDKAIYASGELVVVTIRLANRTDQPMTVGMPASVFQCGYDFTLDGFWRWESRCLPAETQEQLPARSAFVWTRTLDPVETGLFSAGGRHTVRASFYNADSVTFEAAAYQGGVLSVAYLAQDSLRVRPVHDSLKATVRTLTTYPFTTRPPVTVAEWEIRDTLVASVVARYAGDARFQSLRAVHKLRLSASRLLVGTDEATPPRVGMLGAPMPHPFRSATTLAFTPGHSSDVEAVLYDGLGRPVQVIYRGPAEAGVPLRLCVDGTSLTSGLYMLRVQAAKGVYTQRVVRLTP